MVAEGADEQSEVAVRHRVLKIIRAGEEGLEIAQYMRQGAVDPIKRQAQRAARPGAVAVFLTGKLVDCRYERQLIR
jgi:hypothetical protein